MIKKLILAILIALPFTTFAQKFGVVDVNKVFTSMPESTAMQQQLSEASKKYETELSKLREEVDKLYTDYQTIQNDPNTPDAIKERRVQEVQERMSKVEQFRDTAQQDLSRLNEQLAAPIQQKITDAISAVGQEGSYTFIFPNEQGLLLYQGSDVVDVTSAVLKKLGL
jgi:outer membrane protein